MSARAEVVWTLELGVVVRTLEEERSTETLARAEVVWTLELGVVVRTLDGGAQRREPRS